MSQVKPLPYRPVFGLLAEIETRLDNVNRIRSERQGLLSRGDRAIAHKPKPRQKEQKS
jgi:hypothetical protein